MNPWLIVDYGGVLADDHVSAGEAELASALGVSAGDIRGALSERSPAGRALRLNKLAEAEFWQVVAIELSRNTRLLPPPDELTKLWAGCYKIRLDVVDVLQEATSKGVSLGIATNVDRYREKYLIDELNRHGLTMRVWTSYSIGFIKPDVGYFRFIANEVFSLEGQSNCLYVDDRQSHVDAASSIGWSVLKADRAEPIRAWLQNQNILR